MGYEESPVQNTVGGESGGVTFFQAATRGFGDAVATQGVGGGESGLLVGSYRLIEMLGEGASSRVYAAEHLEHGSRVALKLLQERHGESLTKIMRFMLECELLGRIRHPNVVGIIERGETTSHERFVALELLDGETLRDKLFHDGVLSVPEAVAIGLQLARGIEAVHAAGVIHCDIKPDNINLGAGPGGYGDYAVKLFDFDAARWIDTTTARTTAILPNGAILGTPGYMAPEQEQGSVIDQRADIYAFGVVLYEMLAGCSPYVTTTLADKVRSALFATPKPLRSFSHLASNVPAEFEALVRACLERSADRRPASMQIVIDRLEAIAASLQIAAAA